MIFYLIALTLVILYLVYVKTQEAYLTKDPIVQRLVKKLLPTFPELKRVKVMRSPSTSYTLNKYRVYLCVRNQTTKKPFSDNVLTYVLLHELAHALNVNYGHGSTYRSIFGSLLNRAFRANLYTHTYIPTNYCSNPNFPQGTYRALGATHPLRPRKPTTAS